MNEVDLSTPSELRREIDEAVSVLRPRMRVAPEVAVILGTGFGTGSGTLSARLEVHARVPYGEIPGFPVSAVESHAGELVLGRLADRPAVVLDGRAHYYEGYSMRQVAFPVRVARALGARILVLTGASGGMNPWLTPGDIMVVADHINLMGDNPLIGPNDETLGPRFPDMSEPYDRRLIGLAEDVALAQGIRLVKGVYVAVAGPNLETAAEYRFLRGIGGDVVGMSLVPETLVAVHGGMRVLALAVVTDRCWPDALEPVDVARILAVAAEAAPRLERLVIGVLERIDEAWSGHANRG